MGLFLVRGKRVHERRIRRYHRSGAEEEAGDEWIWEDTPPPPAREQAARGCDNPEPREGAQPDPVPPEQEFDAQYAAGRPRRERQQPRWLEDYLT